MSVKRILILDDEQSITFSLSHCLQSENVYVVSCQDSLSAMRALAELKIDVIIADVRLSVINPFEAIQFIRHVRSLHFDVPLIMMSGTDELKMEVLRAGASYFFQKPLDVDRLIQLLRSFGVEAGPIEPVQVLPVHRVSERPMEFHKFSEESSPRRT